MWSDLSQESYPNTVIFTHCDIRRVPSPHQTLNSASKTGIIFLLLPTLWKSCEDAMRQKPENRKKKPVCLVLK